MRLHAIAHLLHARPRLGSSLLLALATGLTLPEVWVDQPATRWLLAWCLGATLYLVLVAHMLLTSSHEAMRRRAQVQAESRFIALLLVVLAAFVGLAAIVAQLATVREMHGAPKLGHLALAVFTILSSWALIHTTFALQYAHDFYIALAQGQPAGLEFPGTPDPDYGDFMYFALVIGTSGQTADVSFTARPMRRVGSLHCVLAFLFNTTLLALMINIAASLF